MRQIMTVTGPANPEELGFCHAHEHLGLSKGQSYLVNPALCIDDTALSAKEAILFKAAGGGTLIDAQPIGCGRMYELLCAVSRASGVKIIASTGFHKLCFYPEDHWLRDISREDLRDIFLQEVTAGMFPDSDTVRPTPDAALNSCGSTKGKGSDVLDPNSTNGESSGIGGDTSTAPRAGQIKTALDTEGIHPLLYKKLFGAAAQAAVASGVPLMVHIEKGSDPLGLLDFLLEQGVKPGHIIFCHMDRAVDDLAIHERVAGQGVYLEYDTIARFKYHSDEEEIAIFRRMLDGGFEDRLLFSLDTTRARLKSYGYDPQAPGLDYILRSFVPMLLESGVTQAQIRKISHDNFVSVFTGP